MAKRFQLNLSGLSLEEIEALATLAEYDDETGFLLLRLNEEHVQELRAVVRSELKDSSPEGADEGAASLDS